MANRRISITSKMQKYINEIKKDKLLLVFFIAYFMLNIVYLTRFPFVHSDESWLSGLSRNIMESKSYSVTESFFDLYPRYPHAIKIIFHTVQMVFIKVFGYKIFAVRLMSLIFGVLSLYFFYRVSKYIFKDRKKALLPLILLALDVQFIYASHFARQEIVIVFFLMVGLYYFIPKLLIERGVMGDGAKIKEDIILGIIIGLSIGIHPNSFIIALPFAAIYLYEIFIKKKFRVKNIIAYGTTVGILALAFVAISLLFNRNFFEDYFNYGKQFGVDYPIVSKVSSIKYFYYKLYEGISGTYYTPNIKLQFWVFVGAFLGTVLKLFYKRRRKDAQRILPIILSILAINLGIIIIGRYNQTSIVFQFPLLYLLIGYLLEDLKLVYKSISFSILALVILTNTILNAIPYLDNSYDRYLNEISKVVKKDQVVLANLNCEFYFDNGKLYDYRNLEFLKTNGMEFEDYIKRNKIEFIIYLDEMEVIYKEQPRWDGLYGKLTYYDEMNKFLEESCELVHQFEDKTYGVRISRYINDRPWKVKIYKVKSTL